MELSQLQLIRCEASNTITTLRQITRKAVKYPPTEIAMLTAILAIEDTVTALVDQIEGLEATLQAIREYEGAEEDRNGDSYAQVEIIEKCIMQGPDWLHEQK